ncbi:MAG: transcriptional repressor [Candidatus Latescibacteria bacterium]|nr:transcriptional repressor [Candidatus Latescibacterota bacterium]NIM21796.1 transcriptional repressor [Candidatus Latescibacterota bacterium]NIM65934.1 transcriptional repressor [Candidatus Latescibacterota bacterium]NIO02679.1 transcriptional repressor [Candidatus Latescibacterota bacterium]NIO29660.1 transcriptional repressor [Candidatus Latescibacterota bacterium]
MTRRTEQRSALRQALQEANRPLSAKELLRVARGVVAGLGIATVYRNIKILADEGWLVPVIIPGEPVRYEVAGKAHHHHFHCRLCDRVFDIPGCALGADRIPAGFELDEHEVVLYGKCADCTYKDAT